MKKIHIFALAVYGDGISGGDRIFVEFAKHWSKTNPVIIYTSESGKRLFDKLVSGLKNIHIIVIKTLVPTFVGEYLFKILRGIVLGLNLKIGSQDVLYSASEFWMDSLPAYILKARYSLSTWAAAWYQTAPNPIMGFSEGRYRFSALLYWLAQLPIKPLIAGKADFVLVNNQLEKEQFVNLNRMNHVLVVLGAVDLDETSKWKNKFKLLKMKYSAVFQGRFHPQKGVVELVKIWKLVTDSIPDAKLVMIGDGPLMAAVKSEINTLGLSKNIELLGYVFDGESKYRAFAQSMIVVHPALYDSGGMAAAEAMAFGIPCVGFDLPSYKDYYPEGMVKVEAGKLELFAKAIIQLLENSSLRYKIGKQAQLMIFKNWSWESRAKQIAKKIF